MQPIHRHEAVEVAEVCCNFSLISDLKKSPDDVQLTRSHFLLVRLLLRLEVHLVEPLKSPLHIIASSTQHVDSALKEEKNCFEPFLFQQQTFISPKLSIPQVDVQLRLVFSLASITAHILSPFAAF